MDLAAHGTEHPTDPAAAVKAKARELGFDLCGIASARPLDPAPLDRWFERGWDAPGIAYVRERRAERLDPSRLLPGARCGIALAASFAPGLPAAPLPARPTLRRSAPGRAIPSLVQQPAPQ